MKRIIILAMVLIMLLTSIGGCWVGWDEGGRDRRHDQDGRQRHGDSGDQEGPRGPGGGGPGGSGGGH